MLIHPRLATWTLIASVIVLSGCKVQVSATDTDTDTDTGTEIDPAPSGESTTEIHIYPDGSTITMPGKDAGEVNGNTVNFDTAGAVPEGSPNTVNPDNTTLIFHNGD